MRYLLDYLKAYKNPIYYPFRNTTDFILYEDKNMIYVNFREIPQWFGLGITKSNIPGKNTKFQLLLKCLT